MAFQGSNVINQNMEVGLKILYLWETGWNARKFRKEGRISRVVLASPGLECGSAGLGRAPWGTAPWCLSVLELEGASRSLARWGWHQFFLPLTFHLSRPSGDASISLDLLFCPCGTVNPPPCLGSQIRSSQWESEIVLQGHNQGLVLELLLSFFCDCSASESKPGISDTILRLQGRVRLRLKPMQGEAGPKDKWRHLMTSSWHLDPAEPEGVPLSELFHY